MHAEKHFYENDKRKYQLQNNPEFLNWFWISTEDKKINDYNFTLSDFEELMEIWTNWYQLKYPDYVIESHPIRDEIRDKNIMRKLINRLPEKQYAIINCIYGKSRMSNSRINRRELRYRGNTVQRYLYDKENDDKSYPICFDRETGVVTYSLIHEIEGLDIESVHQLIKEKYSSKLNDQELIDVINQYNYEVELRHRLLQLTALKILYSATNPELGYLRAKKFIEEMNQELGLLLTTTEIDEIYSRYQQDKEAFQKNPKAYRNQYIKNKR